MRKTLRAHVINARMALGCPVESPVFLVVGVKTVNVYGIVALKECAATMSVAIMIAAAPIMIVVPMRSQNVAYRVEKVKSVAATLVATLMVVVQIPRKSAAVVSVAVVTNAVKAPAVKIPGKGAAVDNVAANAAIMIIGVANF